MSSLVATPGSERLAANHFRLTPLPPPPGLTTPASLWGAATLASRKSWFRPRRAKRDPRRAITDRSGNTLSSGGDCDIVMVALKNGWDTAYVPSLELDHHISAPRLTLGYLQRMAHDSNRSWVNVLDIHGMRPWPSIPPWSLPIRKARAWLRQKPWQGEVQSIRWHAVKGRLRGQADLQPS